LSAAPVARLEGAARRYGRGDGPFALAPTTVAFERGSWTAVTGRSGAGKTTLLHLLAGLDRADAGRVHLFGDDVTGAGESRLARLRRERIGVVHQPPAFLDHLPLWQNVTCRFVPAGVAPRERRERARRALAPFGLDDRLDRLPRELSSGEQQRVALAGALIAAPELLIADEPTANVDAETAAGIADLFARLHAQGTTLIVATHDATLERRADHQIRLVGGEIAP
jgi:putative ABC transport system ATP-binding protein